MTEKRRHLNRLLHELKINPDQLAEYLKLKIKEDRAILKAYPDLMKSPEYYLQDTYITHAEILVLLLS